MNGKRPEQKVRTKMSKTEYDKIVHLMNHGALHGIATGRLDGKCEDVIPLEDAIAIIDLIYKGESEDNIDKYKAESKVQK